LAAARNRRARAALTCDDLQMMCKSGLRRNHFARRRAAIVIAPQQSLRP
jgi:hypothetical protein